MLPYVTRMMSIVPLMAHDWGEGETHVAEQIETC